MLKIYKILPIGFSSNSYLLTKDGKNAVVIDPAADYVLQRAEELGLTVEAALLTHLHFDHYTGCFSLVERGVPVYSAESEKAMLPYDLCLNVGGRMPTFKNNFVLKDGDKITLAGIEFTVITTPGHSVGSVTYRVERNLFTGDTLFESSVGRTDLPTGDWDMLVNSVKKLYALEGDYTVYCGHGEDTTLENERRYNPYVKA